MDHAKPGDIKILVRDHENLILKTSLRILNCVGWHIRWCFILEITKCVYVITFVILICEIRFPVTASNSHFIFWVTTYQREKGHFIPVTSYESLNVSHFILVYFIYKVYIQHFTRHTKYFILYSSLFLNRFKS